MDRERKQRNQKRKGETEKYYKDKAVMGSSTKLMWSIQITYQLDLTDPISVARNRDQGCSFKWIATVQQYNYETR